jgi:ribonuclease J
MFPDKNVFHSDRMSRPGGGSRPHRRPQNRVRAYSSDRGPDRPHQGEHQPHPAQQGQSQGPRKPQFGRGRNFNQKGFSKRPHTRPEKNVSGDDPETKHSKKAAEKIPPPGDNIRIIPLGGVEQIGQNCTMIEYKDDIIVIDLGFQFQEEDTPGIDYILPNTKYLEERKEKIRAVIITHGHLDHTGGIPYIMPRIGNPPIYTRNLTSLMIRKRQEEFPHLDPLDIRIVEKDDHVRIGNLTVRFFAVTHTIPDSMGVIIETPFGTIVNPGDPKLDHTETVPTDAEEDEYGKFKDMNVLLMMNDSTNIENPGFSTPEKLVHKNLEEIIKNIKGRLIIGTFASQMERMIKIIQVCEKYGKKIAIEGRSMKTNIEIAKLAGMLEVKKDTVINAQDIENYPPDRVVILATGAQGEEFAALMRIGNRSHKTLKLNKRDTVLLSSSIIPGNEKAVEKLKDNLARQGAKIIHYRTSDVYIHGSGHGNKGELEWMLRKIHPKFFMPIHGNHYRLKLHADLLNLLVFPKKILLFPITVRF